MTLIRCYWIVKYMITAFTSMALCLWNNYAAMKNALDSYLICDGPYTHYYYRYVHYCRSEATYFVLKCYATGKSDDKKQIRLHSSLYTLGLNIVHIPNLMCHLVEVKLLDIYVG